MVLTYLLIQIIWFDRYIKTTYTCRRSLYLLRKFSPKCHLLSIQWNLSLFTRALKVTNKLLNKYSALNINLKANRLLYLCANHLLRFLCDAIPLPHDYIYSLFARECHFVFKCCCCTLSLYFVTTVFFCRICLWVRITCRIFWGS